MSRAVVVAAFGLPLVPATAQSLLCDLRPGFYSGSGTFGAGATTVSGEAVFTGFASAWISDGTTAGTRGIFAIDARTNNSGAFPITALSSGLLLAAPSTPELGRELWVSDGTAVGTRLLVDFRPGPQDGRVGGFVALGSFAVFVADDGVHGSEPWISDGTLAGTQLLVDLVPGPGSGSFQGRLGWNGHVFFLADPISGSFYKVFASDGTAAGTFEIANGATVVPSSGVPTPFITAGNRVLFVASRGTSEELWESDGTPAGSRLLMIDPPAFPALSDGVSAWGVGRFATGPIQTMHIDLATLTFTAIPRTDTDICTPLLALPGGRCVHLARDPVLGLELHVSAAAAPAVTPTLLADLSSHSSGVAAARPIGSIGSGGLIGVDTNDQDLIVVVGTDGTPVGTQVLLTRALSDIYGARSLGSTNGRLLFLANDPIFRTQLFASDATPGGTALLSLVNPIGNSSLPREARRIGRSVWFNASGAVGRAWYSSDLTAGSCTLVSTPRYPLILASNETGGFLTRVDSAFGDELWWTDGSAAPPVLIGDFLPGAAGISPRTGVMFGELLVFDADDGVHGREPWVSDGTAAGTSMLLDVHPTLASNPQFVAVLPDGVVFRADDPTRGRELWLTDGTTAGTLPFNDVRVGGFGLRDVVPHLDPSPIPWTVLLLDDFTSGLEPWLIDGATRTVGRIADTVPGGGGIVGQILGRAGSRVVWSHRDATTGFEPWATDGTAAGTMQLVDANPGPADGLVEMQAGSVGDALLFQAESTSTGRELWITDGTPTGTQLLVDISPGPASSRPRGFADLGDGRACFVAFDPGGGFELWTSDGSAAGTGRALEIIPGPMSSFLESGPIDLVTSHLAAAGPRTWFPALALLDGVEPRVADLVDAVRAPWTRRWGRAFATTFAMRVAANGPPVTGNAAFALTISGGPPTAAAVMLFGFVALDPAPPGSFGAASSPPWIDVGFTFSGQGARSLAVPIPPAPSLLGLRLVAQPIALRAGGALFGALEAGHGIAFGIGR